MEKKLDVGIKMETDIVSWCVADGLDVVKRYGRDCIGARYFGKAKTSGETRRIFRTERRRISRRKERLRFLKTLFRDPISNNEIDPSLSDPEFFERLKNEEDTLFPTKEETREFRRKYPTIFHLTLHLMQEPEPDVRLIYLALKDLMEHRGTFSLNINADADGSLSFQALFEAMLEKLRDAGMRLDLSDADKEKIEEVLKSRDNKKLKKTAMEETFAITKKDKDAAAVIGLLNGSKVDLKNLFPESMEEADKTESKICFMDDYEQERERISAFLNEDELEIMDAVRNVYDIVVISKILGSESSYIEGKAKSYDVHQADLQMLRDILLEAKKYEGCNRLYWEMFEDMTTDQPNYCRYVKKGFNSKNKRKTPSSEEFYDFVKKCFGKIRKAMEESPDEALEEKMQFCEESVENDVFMPKQRTRANGIIPNAIIRLDLMKLLACQKQMHTWLGEESKWFQSGLTCEEELLEYFSFTVPFWIGPLNPEQKTAWVVRKEPGAIFPWNLADKVDFVKTRRAFITMLTDKCQLMMDESVLPDNSYYVRKMEVFDELGRITVNGSQIPPRLKQEIFQQLFLTKNTVTQKDILDLLRAENWEVLSDLDAEEIETTGFVKKKCVHTMDVYLAAKKILPEICIEDYETIAEYVSVFKDDKKTAQDCLMDLLSIEGETLKKLISAVKVTGWSKYSKKALTEVLGAKAEGGKEKRTILETLEQSTDTLYTILGPDYTFFETFKKENAATLKQMEIGDVIDRITANPILRRSMNQTAHILNDIRRAYGKDVGTVYINMYLPANERALSMTALRRKLLVALRKAQKKSFADLLDALKEINMRQYLWFSQLGTDIYTGEDIPYAEIGNGEKWTVDHIYPQSRVYDNTYNNLCLTHRDTNRDKSNQYPIAEEIRNKMERFWKTLLSMELITSAKYDALVSSYFDMDKAFETADKILIEKRIMALEYEALISRILPDVKVVHVNKLLLNDFKKSSPAFLYRNAEIFENDKALDAYYTVLVGRTWHTIFGDYPKRYMRQNKQYTLNVYNVKTDAWDPSASLKKAEEVVTALNPVQTQMVDTNTQGELFNTMRISGFAAARSKVRKAPVKQGKEDVAKYGGYLSIKAAYFCLIQHGEGIVTLENVKIMDLPKIKGDDDLIKYFEEKGYKNVSIVKRKLGSYTPLCVGGNKCYITSGESGRIRYWNAIPFMMKPSEMRTYLLKIGYLSGRTKQFDKKEVERCTRPELKAISKDKNLRLFNEICETLKMIYACRTNGGTSVDKIFEQKKEFEKLDAFTQCRVLINITKFGQRKMQGTDLREIGLAKLFGIDTLSIHFKPGMNVSLLEESATGMYFKQEQIQQ